MTTRKSLLVLLMWLAMIGGCDRCDQGRHMAVEDRAFKKGVPVEDLKIEPTPNKKDATIDPAMLIHFKGREIELLPYLEGFKYIVSDVDMRSGCIFYLQKGVEQRLMMLKFDPAGQEQIDFSKGRIISTRDFAKRTLWGIFCNPNNDKVVMLADQNADEHVNLYELDPASGEERPLTHVNYIYNYSLSFSGNLIAYTSRSGDEGSPGDLRVLDLRSGGEVVYHHDSKAARMTWGNLSWRPDDQGILASFLARSDRTRANLMYLPLVRGARPKVLTDVRREKTDVYSMGWINQDEVFFVSDDSQTSSVYRLSLSSGKTTLVSAPDENVKESATTVRDGVEVYAVTVTGNPLKSSLKLFDSAGRLIFEKPFPGSLSIDGADTNKVFLTSSSIDSPFTKYQLEIKNGQVDLFERAQYPQELMEKIKHCNYEKVSFRTFDDPQVPGESPGMLHGYLMSPKNPQQGADRRVLVQAFYGGYNQYNSTFEMFCEAGLYVFSPALRGTEEFGTRLYNLGNNDLGGGETIDVCMAGQYVQERLGLSWSQVGIFGGSRGGYDTLRALTFPGEVNGIKVECRFGFGISDFGMSNIPRAYKTGNIPQWYTKMTGGDPTGNLEKWNDRSPEYHVDRLSVPLLLTHGSNDRRVPPEESRSFFQKANDLGKQVRYVEFPGQGHGYKGTATRAAYHKAVFEFLGSF